ncbi:MAG: hypothetical protein KKE20_02255 [Nanoarchaeota archaeon]|nr:hypothetical protein [Nanoarchaeota archaeon]
MEEQKAVCRRCNRRAKVSEFVLDHVYKMMVCDYCVKERKNHDMIHSQLKTQKDAKLKEKEAAKEKPAGWDQDDEYLEKMHKQKMKKMAIIENVTGDRTRYKCPKCSYSFTHGTYSKTPLRCPYCDTQIRV